MRRVSLILALALLSGLLIIGQALAAEQYQQRDTQTVVALSGEQLRQWNLAQDRAQAQHQMRIATQQLTREQVIEMKNLLNQQGYRVSHIDGIIGNETMAAIEHFQKAEGLATTGMPNQETLRALAPSNNQQEFFGLAPEFIGNQR
jgi:peptidoglycan hydrolase-like protein with peptidoglycan-binding domain